LTTLLVTSVLLYSKPVSAGPYLDSAHGNYNPGYGVLRTSLSTPPNDYGRGNCAHCHEKHASIGGSEPTPTGGPSGYELFYSNYVSQTDDFCFECHVDVNSYQSGESLINRSYSYRAGGYTADTLNDIKEAFSFTAPATSHNLGDIRTFINGKWGYTSDSNPCAACHNPHMAKGDPANAGNAAKSSTTRGWPVSLPSQHSKDNNAWGLWGDGAGEKMSDCTANYQAPYRYNSTTTYEPDGSTTTSGSNLTDYATFCTDCHNTTYTTINSTPLVRNLKTINWSTEKHGNGVGNAALALPYTSGPSGPNYVLSCTDCHEPHGSPNSYLTRKEVNNGVVTITGNTMTTKGTEWASLCERCHPRAGLETPHHTAPLSSDYCSTCHPGGSYAPCIVCHYHGSTFTGSGYTNYPIF
ncbi:MAG: cytochrome c3 family protein, partial [Actinobacteria bacterium]|nr:cytochrome c3 family protein [Actinomycetota bacterium]